MSGPPCPECGEHFLSCACIKENPKDAEVDSCLYEMRMYVRFLYDNIKTEDYNQLTLFFDQRLLTVENWWRNYKEKK